MTPGELRQWANAHAQDGSSSYSPVAKAVLDLFAAYDVLAVQEPAPVAMTHDQVQDLIDGTLREFAKIQLHEEFERLKAKKPWEKDD